MSRVHSLIDLGCATFYSIIPFHGEYYGDLFLFPLEYILKDFKIWLVSLVGKVSFNSELKFIAEFMKFFEKTGEGGDPSEANMLLGAPTTTLEQWCKMKRNTA